MLNKHQNGLYMEHIYDSEILLRAGKRIKRLVKTASGSSADFNTIY